MAAPRILYVSPWYPATPKSASEWRAVHVARALRDVGDVQIALIRPSDYSPTDDDAGDCRIIHDMRTRAYRNRGWAKKAQWLLDPRFPLPHGSGADEKDARLLRSGLDNFDLVWFYKLRTANMFPFSKWPRSVVDIDDVPSQYERSVLSEQDSLHKRVATGLRVWSWRRRERLLGDRFAVLTVCSEADRRYLAELGTTAPITVIPNGSERPLRMPVRRRASPPRLGFIGVFDHAPNAEGVQWFVERCWPLVKACVPDARLRLVGRLTDGPLKPAGPDIDALGYLTEPNDEMATWSAMIVPVRTGAGTRGKIAHAFGQKCPVVSTTLGAHGYEPNHGRDMLLGDTVKEFADACIVAIRQPQAAAAIADRAWERFLETWTWDAIRPQVWAAAEACLGFGEHRTHGRAHLQAR